MWRRVFKPRGGVICKWEKEWKRSASRRPSSSSVVSSEQRASSSVKRISSSFARTDSSLSTIDSRVVLPPVPVGLTEPVKSGEKKTRSVRPKASAPNRRRVETLVNVAMAAALDRKVARRRLQRDDFKLLKTIGTGSFGRVFLARDREGGIVAIKRLSKRAVVKMKQVEHVESEKEILTAVDHPFVIRLNGTFQDQRYLYIAMEYVIGGEFFTYLRRAKRLDDAVARFYAAQIVLLFEYLHGKRIVYRDLKPENLLIARNGYLKLTDFGFAKFLESGRTYTLCGTPEYIAPEILLNKGHGLSVDWWALGIFVYEMIVGYPPFFDEDALGIYQKILSGTVVFPRLFPKDAKSLVKHLLVHNPIHRMGHVNKEGVCDVRAHRWFKNFPLNQLLQCTVQPPYVPHVEADDDSRNFGKYDEEDDETADDNDAADADADPDPFATW